MTAVAECRWCGQELLRHRVGNGITVWVHRATNVVWCFAGAPALAATPLGRRGG